MATLHFIAAFGTMENWLAIEENGANLLRAMISWIRPQKNPEDIEGARQRIQNLTEALSGSVVLRARTRAALAELFATRRAGSLYMNLGILPSTGFFSETWRRVSHTLLPEEQNPEEFLGDMLQSLFDRKTDEIWVCGVEDEVWIHLLQALNFGENNEDRASEELVLTGDSGAQTPLPPSLQALLHSLWLLSYQMTAMGFDPEILRLTDGFSRSNDVTDSPFLAQNLETRVFVECCLSRWQDADAISNDEKQLLVLFDQCGTAIERIHRRSMQAGTSLRLTYKLQCMRDHLVRSERLALIAGELLREKSGLTAYPSIVALFKHLVSASCRKNDLAAFWRENLEITARRITEYAGKAGEHYITETRSEYLGMARAALGAGACIALIALLKLIFHRGAFAPLNEMLIYGLNYGLGFMFIYMLGFTIATKQPAMTANALAASIGEARGKMRDLENLITLIARATRSQLVAILGNVMMAVPTAVLVSLCLLPIFGHTAISETEAEHLLEAHHPFLSGTLIFAAFAGICLFLSGLVAGYFDNLSAYSRIPQRLKRLAWAKRLLGDTALCRFADYIERNLGALAGNFLFGMMLASVWGLGMLLGLPLDIRHVAFSSAYLGYALAAYDFSPPITPFLWAVAGVAGVGIVNLSVSFFLALSVALRARGVTFSQGRQLLRGLFRRFCTHPGEFFLPPKKESAAKS
ncbi:MAG: site-specific recombinase [Zoogloeaceae bacterium]|jgi:site-specific recombinase|nr:site-specific recombinase [Zoogloeaceae bacterium]